MTDEEQFAFACSAFDRKLSELGLDPGRYEPRDSRRGDAADLRGVTCRFTGRDPSGHADECEIDISLRDDADMMLRSIESKMTPQARSALRVDFHAPVHPGPAMQLGHLRVFTSFARRLRMDHADGAQEALRHALRIFREGAGKKLRKYPRPYGLAMDANRVDHREDLAEGVHLKGRHVILHSMILPDQLLGGIVGQPVTRIVQHPLLDDGMTITRAYSEKSSAMNGGGVTVLDLQGEYVPGDRI